MVFKQCSFCRERHWCYAHAWPWRQFISISRPASIACNFHIPRAWFCDLVIPLRCRKNGQNSCHAEKERKKHTVNIKINTRTDTWWIVDSTMLYCWHCRYLFHVIWTIKALDWWSSFYSRFMFQLQFVVCKCIHVQFWYGFLWVFGGA